MSSLPLRLFAEPQMLAEAAAREVASALEQAVAARGRASIALAGGSTPRLLYERLAETQLAKDLPWDRIEIFFGDERMVGADDPESNYRMARETLFDRLQLSDARIHRIEGELEPELAASRYAEAIAEFLPLDVALLGMGDDGHIASIFSVADLMAEGPVIVTKSPTPPATRVSLSLGVLNQARAIVFLITGAGKAERLAEVWKQRRARTDAQDPTGKLSPAACVRPREGTLSFFVDRAAAARIPPEWILE